MSLAIHPAKHYQSPTNWNIQGATPSSSYNVTSPRDSRAADTIHAFQLPPTPTPRKAVRPLPPSPAPRPTVTQPRSLPSPKAPARSSSYTPITNPQQKLNPNFIGGIRSAFDTPTRPTMRRQSTAPGGMPFRPSIASSSKLCIDNTPSTKARPRQPPANEPESPDALPPIKTDLRSSHTRSKSDPSPIEEQMPSLGSAARNPNAVRRTGVDGGERRGAASGVEPSIRERLAFFSTVTTIVSLFVLCKMGWSTYLLSRLNREVHGRIMMNFSLSRCDCTPLYEGRLISSTYVYV